MWPLLLLLLLRPARALTPFAYYDYAGTAGALEALARDHPDLVTVWTAQAAFGVGGGRGQKWKGKSGSFGIQHGPFWDPDRVRVRIPLALHKVEKQMRPAGLVDTEESTWYLQGDMLVISLAKVRHARVAAAGAPRSSQESAASRVRDREAPALGARRDRDRARVARGRRRLQVRGHARQV